MKNDAVFKHVFNTLLDAVAAMAPTDPLESASQLTTSLNASRSTIRKAFMELEQRGIVVRRDKQFVVNRTPARTEYFPVTETVSTSDHVEQKFLEWVLRSNAKPGEQINGLELAREFGVSTIAIRDCLNRFSRFGLFEKRANSGWIMRGFTKEFALELFEIREMFELRSAQTFALQPANAPAWGALARIESEHRALLAQIDARFHDFSALDERFHRLISNASRNRFMEHFYDVISLVFHYHYQWNKADERERNAVAITEHLAYIEALRTRDAGRIEGACRRHLASARETLLRSIR